MLTALVLALTMPAMAKDCTPWFYKTLPRDSSWFYAAGVGNDADEARRQAIQALTDTYHTASGMEQDDHAVCDGRSYVLVRIEKRRVAKLKASMKEEQAFRDKTLSMVDERARKTEQRVAEVENTAASLATIGNGPITINVAGREPVAPVTPLVAALHKKELTPLIKKHMANIDSGKYTVEDVAAVAVAYNTMRDQAGMDAFCKRMLKELKVPPSEQGFREWLAMRCAMGATGS